MRLTGGISLGVVLGIMASARNNSVHRTCFVGCLFVSLASVLPLKDTGKSK